MHHSVVSNKGAASPKAARSQSKVLPAVIKLGVDIHSRQYVVVAQHGHAAPKPPQRLTPAAFVPWVEGLLRAGHTVHVVYEACGFGFGLQRALAAVGARCVVTAPRKLDEARTGVKTDARDAATLCQRLGRYLEGNHKELAIVRVPTEQEEQVRHVHRQREALVRARTKLQAQGRALLITHGLPTPALWWRARTWPRFTRLLPAWMVTRLEVFRPILEALDAQIALLNAELEAAAPEVLPLGLGKLTYATLAREVCDWSRFRNRRQVSSYTGLCPGEYSSGDKRVQGHVTKHGNPRLRAALVELAWRLVRFQPAYPPVNRRLATLAKGARATGIQRKKAIVAVARQLAVDLWRLHTGQCAPAALGLVV